MKLVSFLRMRTADSSPPPAADVSWFFRIDRVQPGEPGVLIALSGRLGHATYGELQSLLAQVLRDHPNRIVLELSNVDYISSPGLRVLFEAASDVQAGGGIFELRGIKPPVRVALDLAAPAGAFVIQDSC